MQILRQLINDFESTKQFLCYDSKQSVTGDCQYHTRYTSKASGNTNYYKYLHWVSMHTVSENNGLCEEIID